MTVLKGIDISNWQKGLNLANSKPDFVIVKATEGLNFVDQYCDGFIQDAISLNISFGFYHFARSNNAAAEATYFYSQTKGYIGKGIPILDFEIPNSNEWLESFCKTYYRLSGIKPWIYMNSDYVNNRKYGTDWLKANCGLWIAGYPYPYTYYPNSTCPYKHDEWTLTAWQFSSSLIIDGRSVDGDFFYGDKNAWNKYAGIDTSTNTGTSTMQSSTLDLAVNAIKGIYGNGQDRKNALGSRYDKVQSKINDLYDKAHEVLKGTYGNGQDRKNALGDEYEIVQYIVNSMIE